MADPWQTLGRPLGDVCHRSTFKERSTGKYRNRRRIWCFCNRLTVFCIRKSGVIIPSQGVIIPNIYGDKVVILTCLDAVGKKPCEKCRKTRSFQCEKELKPDEPYKEHSRTLIKVMVPLLPKTPRALKLPRACQNHDKQLETGE
jgi:hypothetical protein